MRRILLPVTLFLLCPTAEAMELPSALWEALPVGLAQNLETVDFFSAEGLREGLRLLWQGMQETVAQILRSRMGDGIALLTVVLLCGLVEAFFPEKSKVNDTVLAGALAIGTLAAGDMDSMMGLSMETMDAMNQFSKTLLPLLTSALATAGGVTRASVWQVSTVFAVDVLLTLITQLFAPLVYVYLGLVTANAVLSGERLRRLATAVKKGITWCLTGVLTLFTGYLSITGAASAGADGLRLKLTKMAVSTGVPVVGGVLSEATESMLAGATVLKNAIGLFGMLAVLGVCLLPFLHLAVQYLVYKVAAFVSGTAGEERLVKLIDDLGGGFGLLLGMTAACAMLLLISLTTAIRLVSL